MSTDTIVALASPRGVGAINVLRMSGARAVECLRKILSEEKAAEDFAPRRIYLRRLHDNLFLDHALLTVFPAPHSYTGDDVVEIYCHGGEIIANRIIEALLRHGCRLAEAGEFTRRAVENGKLDLLQAEAIGDLINAESAGAADIALRQLDGELSSKIKSFREQLIRIAALLELELDFSEEDVRFADRQEIDEMLTGIIESIKQLLGTYEKGRGLRGGIRVAIVGKPNVGKSSLLNAIVGSERAIVSEHPGTTRDFIEEAVRIGGNAFRFIDTAGIRRAKEEIEQEGIARTKRRIHDADILLFVIDDANPLDELDEAIGRECRSAADGDALKKIIMVRNKIDIAQRARLPESIGIEREVSISALSGKGIDQLLQTISEIARKNFFPEQKDIFITNLRQKQALEKSLDDLRLAQVSATNKLSGEFIARDLRAAADELAGLIGEITSDHILDELFAHFCIGK